MTRFSADAPADRRALVAEAAIAHRTRSSETAAFEADGRRLTYADRVLTVRLGADAGAERADGDRPVDEEAPRSGGAGAGRPETERVRAGADEERDRLDGLLDDYPVFKVAQPATRTADDDVVYVSAIADPKHLADFVDDCFRRVYGLPDDYELWVVRI